ncbi:MAG: serine/threonine protein kinase [Bradymonadia bacterium]
MMICPKCGQQYESLTERCATDDAKLVIERTGQLVEERYRLEYPVGVGGMGGAVWAALDLQNQTKVAVKIVPSVKNTAAERFKRGAIIAKNLQHENITKVLGYGQTQTGELFLVMELLQGNDLHVFSQTRSLTLARLLEMIDEVLAALDHAHGKGVLHRDIKLGNIFIATDESGQEKVKILDFGIARYLGEFDSADPRALKPVTAVNQLCGTPQYMAPEQVQFQDVDHRVDIYAIGVAMYRLLAGEFPYDGSVVDVFRAHVSAPIPKISAVYGHLANPEAADAWLAKAMAKRPENRFQSAREMRQHLWQLSPTLGSAGSPSEPEGVAIRFEAELEPDESLISEPPDEQLVSRRPIGLIGVGITAVVALALYALQPFGHRSTAEEPQTIDQTSEQNASSNQADRVVLTPGPATKQAVKLYSNPPGAMVLIGKETLGQTPHRFSLPVGVHPLTVKKDGFKTRTLSLEVTRITDGVMTEAVTLVPANGDTRVPRRRPTVVKKRLNAVPQKTGRQAGASRSRKSKKESVIRVKKTTAGTASPPAKSPRPQESIVDRKVFKGTSSRQPATTPRGVDGKPSTVRLRLLDEGSRREFEVDEAAPKRSRPVIRLLD